MKYLSLTIVFLIFPLISGAQRVVFAKSDSAKVEELLRKSKQQKQGENMMMFFGKQFVGIPYVAATLEVERDENLIVNLREMDCTTLVETVAALTLASREDKPKFKDFCKYLKLLRYKGGVINGYASRLHYFSSWIDDKESMKLVKEIGASANSRTNLFTGKQTLNLSYMTSHPESYPALKRNKSLIPLIGNEEKHLTGKSVRYIPKSLLGGSQRELSPIKDGDIIAIVTSKSGLDTSHLGIAIWIEGKLHLLNASRLRGKVVVEPRTLKEYMLTQKSQTGIRIIRLL